MPSRRISREEALKWSAVAAQMMAGSRPAKRAAVTGQLARAARVGLGLSIEAVSLRSDVPAAGIELFEQHDKADRQTRWKIVDSLIADGAGFATDGDLRGVFFRC